MRWIQRPSLRLDERDDPTSPFSSLNRAPEGLSPLPPSISASPEANSLGGVFSVSVPVPAGMSDAAAAAEEEERTIRVPMYMFILDLSFSATFAVSAQILQLSPFNDDDSVPRFFATFLPICWLWDHANRFFNRFDQEDLISELVVIVLMGGAMALALNMRACFFWDLLKDGEQEPTMASCSYVAAAYGTCRGTLSLLTLYVSAFVPRARRLLCSEAALWLVFLGPCLVLMGSPILGGLFSLSTSRRYQYLLLTACLGDMAVTLRDELPLLSFVWRRRWPVEPKGVALEGRYTIMRHERMVIISIGSVCLNATKEAFDTLETFDWHGLAMCVAVPWVAFLIKVRQGRGPRRGPHRPRLPAPPALRAAPPRLPCTCSPPAVAKEGRTSHAPLNAPSPPPGLLL